MTNYSSLGVGSIAYVPWDLTRLPNNAVERTASSHSLAAAAHCERL